MSWGSNWSNGTKLKMTWGSGWVHSEQNSMKRLLLVHSGCRSGCLRNQCQSGRGASYRLSKAGTTCYTERNQWMQWINECVWWWYHIIQHCLPRPPLLMSNTCFPSPVLIDTGISCVMTEAIPTGPEVSGGQTGASDEWTVYISATNYLPGASDEWTVWKTVTRGAPGWCFSCLCKQAKHRHRTVATEWLHEVLLYHWIRNMNGMKENWVKWEDEWGKWMKRVMISHHSTSRSLMKQLSLSLPRDAPRQDMDWIWVPMSSIMS